MLSYSDILPKKFIIIDGEPYEVLEAHVFRKQQRKPVNNTKVRNVKTGKVTERSFHQNETVEEAAIEKQRAVFIYEKQGAATFHAEGDKSNRFSVPTDTIGVGRQFLSEGTLVDVLVFDGTPIGIELPIKLDLEVAEAPPAVRGNTAQGGTKSVVLSTGASVTVPLFINAGDIIRVNTETGQYVERVEKSNT